MNFCEKTSGLAERIKNMKAPIVNFLESRYYPPLVAALVLLGHILGAELYLNFIIIASVLLSLVLCHGTKPLMIVIMTFIFQVPLKHTPGIPTFSDYYLHTGRLVVIIILAVPVVAALVYRFALLCRGRLSFKSGKMLLPILILCAAFIMNGAFSKGWSLGGLVWGAAQLFVFFFCFYIFYFGIDGEDKEELMSYLCYITLCTAGVLVGQVAFMYLTYDGLIVDGSIVKEAINLGWGIWNPIGHSLTVLIPLQIYGAMKEKYYPVYIVGACLTYVAAILTLSRNAMIFATPALVLGFVIGCFFGNRKRLFRILTAAGAAAVILALVLLRTKIAGLLSDIFERGFSDNGRLDLWRVGIDNFLSAPIFGTGFFGYGDTGTVIVADFIPTMAHHTPVELLSATGIVGLLAYAFYRYKSLIPFVKKPSLEKSMLLIPIALTLGMSLLDNFVFYIYTMFYYSILLATAHKWFDEQASSEAFLGAAEDVPEITE